VYQAARAGAEEADERSELLIRTKRTWGVKRMWMVALPEHGIRRRHNRKPSCSLSVKSQWTQERGCHNIWPISTPELNIARIDRHGRRNKHRNKCTDNHPMLSKCSWWRSPHHSCSVPHQYHGECFLQPSHQRIEGGTAEVCLGLALEWCG
jgi:hypothetical protein